MRSLQLTLLLAFLAVALVAVVVLGLLVGGATTSAFGDYLAGRQTSALGAMGRMMDEMMGPAASRVMLAQMLGPAERIYLEAVQRGLWLAAAVAALAAAVLSLLLASRITGPLREVAAAAARLARGDFGQRVPVRTRDELGELAAAFNAMAEALGRQEALRRHMAADIAHELRTPLAVLQANLEAMLDGVRPVTVEAVAELHHETELLARLVADLRDLSLAEAGQLPLRRQPTDLAGLARTTVGQFVARAESKDVRLAVVAADDLPPADVDPDRVAQVLSNLLDNALRHTPAGGAVEVRVEPGTRPDNVHVAVRDSGPGIPAEHLPHVFERFYRVDPARARAEGGSGIGLAVVKQLVEAHGGTVTAESRPGQGTTFRLTLPVPTTESARAATAAIGHPL